MPVSVGDSIRSSVPGSGINQTSFMFGAVMLAYLFFITVKGDLATWLGLLGLSGASGASVNTGSGGTVASNTVAANTGLPALTGLPAIPNTGAANLPIGGV